MTPEVSPPAEPAVTLPVQAGAVPASEAWMAAVLDNLSDALVACDAHGRLTVFNRAAQHLHGLPAEPIPAERWAEHYDLYLADGRTLMPPDQVPLLRVLRGETVRNVEMVIAPTGREPNVMLASGQQIRDVHGRVEGAVVVMHDVTDLRAAERLRADQLRLEQRRRAAEDSLLRLHQLNTAALEVHRQVTVDDVLQALTAQAAAIIGAEQAVASLTRGEDWSQAVTAVVMGDRYDAWSEYASMPDGSGIYALVCETNRPLRLTQAELEEPSRWRGFGAHAPEHPPMRGWLAVPLMRRDGSNLGLIQLSDKRGRDERGEPAEFDSQDEALLVQLAQIASLALEKAVEYEREHQVAVALQRSLLPAQLPTVEGLQAQVAYVPGRGEPDLAVGGDFFDLFELDGDRVALALGDVVGHGLRAASLMGQIRSALRGLAMQQADPQLVVDALDRLVATLAEEAMATLSYGVLHLGTGRLDLVSAGHPPPLRRGRDGVTQVVADAGLPLGAIPGGGYTSHTVDLPVGATLLMYSDGLAESRTRPIGEGLVQLQDAFGTAPEDLAESLAWLLHAMTPGGSNDDDVALLAVRRTAG